MLTINEQVIQFARFSIVIDLDLFFWIDSDWWIYVSQQIQCSSLSTKDVNWWLCLHLILIRNTFLSAGFRLFLFLLRMALWIGADGAVLKYSLAVVRVIPAWLLHHHYTWWMIVTCQVHHLLKCQKICRPLCGLSLDYIKSAPLCAGGGCQCHVFSLNGGAPLPASELQPPAEWGSHCLSFSQPRDAGKQRGDLEWPLSLLFRYFWAALNVSISELNSVWSHMMIRVVLKQIDGMTQGKE